MSGVLLGSVVGGEHRRWVVCGGGPGREFGEEVADILGWGRVKRGEARHDGGWRGGCIAGGGQFCSGWGECHRLVGERGQAWVVEWEGLVRGSRVRGGLGRGGEVGGLA